MYGDLTTPQPPCHYYTNYSSSFGILLHCLDDVVEKLLVFRLQSGEGGSAGVETKDEVVQLLAKLLADSIFSTNPVRHPY